MAIDFFLNFSDIPFGSLLTRATGFAYWSLKRNLKMSKVHSGTIKQIYLKNIVYVLLSGYILKNSDRNQSYIPIPIYNLKMSKVHSGTIKLRPLK